MSQPPKPTELIYQPQANPFPALFAVGIAAVVVGLYAWWPYSGAGALVAIVSIIAWWRRDRAEMSALPTEQETDTAPVPLR